jgi:hypothetical protein
LNLPPSKKNKEKNSNWKNKTKKKVVGDKFTSGKFFGRCSKYYT